MNKKRKNKEKTEKETTKIEFLKNSLLIDSKIIVLTDFHLGQEKKIINKGLLPNIYFQTIIKDLDKLFKNLFFRGKIIKKIIILGDLKHDFKKAGEEEWREANKLINYLIKKVGNKNIILIKGNHDNYLKQITNKKEIQLLNHYQYKDTLFLHGHKKYERKIKNKEIKKIILGHLHPAINLRDEYKQEKYKCFLIGKWMKKIIYVIPSFNNITTGFKVTTPKYQKRENYEFFIIPEKKLKEFKIKIFNEKENKTYDFGKIKNFSD